MTAPQEMMTSAARSPTQVSETSVVSNHLDTRTTHMENCDDIPVFAAAGLAPPSAPLLWMHCTGSGFSSL